MDVLIFNTLDGGELKVQDSAIFLTGGFETAVYLSLFGGQLRDNGSEATDKFTWWGNRLDNNELNDVYISRTQFILEGEPFTLSNINNIREAMEQDLQWMIDERIMSSIDVDIFIDSVNSLKITIDLFAEGNEECPGAR